METFDEEINSRIQTKKAMLFTEEILRVKQNLDFYMNFYVPVYRFDEQEVCE